MFRLNEDKYLDEIRAYIEGTYSKHYTKSNRQTIETIMERGRGEGFCLGNVSKYADRYGFKNGKNRDDLLKLVHYSILALINHDLENKKVT